MTRRVKSLSIRPVTAENWRATLPLIVRPDQQRFVAGYAPISLVILAKAYVQPLGLRWEPYAFYLGERPIGMVALACDLSGQDGYWMNHFFLDAAFQGKGYGLAAGEAFIRFVRERYPLAESLRLTVHPENVAAQTLYTRLHFAPTGEEVDGEPVYRLTLSEDAR